MIRLERETLAQLFAIGAICIGGWMMFIDPVQQEIAELEGQLEEMKASGIVVDEAGLKQQIARVDEIRDFASSVVERNRMASDTLRMASLLNSVAERHGVEITRLQPGAAMQGQDTGPTVSRVDVYFEATYETAARFATAVQALDGFIRPVTLKVIPIDKNGTHKVSGRLAAEFFEYQVPESLVQVMEAGNAQP